MTEQAEPSESKKSKTPGALTRWATRNSSRATIWLSGRSCQGLILIVTSMCQSTMAATQLSRKAAQPIGPSDLAPTE